jgi:multiple sugar transport system permease protein
MRQWAAAVIALAAVGLAAQPMTLRIAGSGLAVPDPNALDPNSQVRRAVYDEFRRQNPDLRVANAGGLQLAGDLQENAFLLSMAGDSAPDVFYVNFRQYFSYLEQGFMRPLDGLIEQNPEALSRVKPETLEVLRSQDGRLYAVPFFQAAQGLYYRRDHFQQAGLDPSRPPRTWAEFISYGRRLTESAPDRSGFVFSSGLGGKAYWWSNFVWQAGGEVLEPTGDGGSRSAIDSPEAAQALDFFKRLTVEKWANADGQPRGPIARLSTNFQEDIAQGRVSMWFAYSNDLLLNVSSLNPSLIGIAAMPAGPAGSAGEINAGMWAINSQIKDPKRLEACWRFIRFFAGDEAARVSTDRFVELGMSQFVNPLLLEKFGYEREARAIDPAFREANEQLFERGHPEPYGRGSQQVYRVLDGALDRALLNPQADSRGILREVSKEMDAILLGYVSPQVRAQQRQAAWWIAGLVALASAWALTRVKWRLPASESGLPAGANRQKMVRFMLFAILPAAALIALWAYYPLAQGLVMAFQDKKLTGGSEWVGWDNFIAVFTQPVFWRSIGNSFVFVGLTLGLGFFLPLILALALEEIRWGRLLFRTLFYLPAMTSPLVIAFLWRQFYDPAPTGFLNSLVGPVVAWMNGAWGTQWPTSFNWLGDPNLAMIAVVLPGVWAAAGPGSILYLAALKNIPASRYEAADLDGAGPWAKLRWIVLPALRPLILINLLGAFIGGFKATENIFVLTGGGPLYSTHVIGLEVWANAFLFLKFGYATAAAWVMGAILVGFTVLQLRTITRMKFRSAAG